MYGMADLPLDDQPIIVPYVLAAPLRRHDYRIRNAMVEIQNHSRVEFVPSQDDGHCLLIRSGDGCSYSPYDCIGNRPQSCRPMVSLGDGCRSFGIILHELMHAIGFEHEHQRPDRNQYLTINRRNIQNDQWSQFRILNEAEYGWSVSGFEFDYASIMMYGEYYFSRNGHKTIETKYGRQLSNNKNRLSRMDKEKLSQL